jgi:hypothetical protein
MDNVQNHNTCSIVPVYKKGDNADCSNHREISMLSTSYDILSNISLSEVKSL